MIIKTGGFLAVFATVLIAGVSDASAIGCVESGLPSVPTAGPELFSDRPLFAKGTAPMKAQMARGTGSHARVQDPAWDDLIRRQETRDSVTRKRPNEELEVNFEDAAGEMRSVRGHVSNVVRNSSGDVEEVWVTQKIRGADANGAKVTHVIPIGKVTQLERAPSAGADFAGSAVQEGDLLQVKFDDGRGARILKGQVVGITRDGSGKIVDIDLELPRNTQSKGLAWRIKSKDVRDYETLAVISGDVEKTVAAAPAAPPPAGSGRKKMPEPSVLSTKIIDALDKDLRARGVVPQAIPEDAEGFLAELRVKPEPRKSPAEARLDKRIAELEAHRAVEVAATAKAVDRAIIELEEAGLKAETDALIASLPKPPARPRATLPPPYKGWKPKDPFVPESGHVILGKWSNGGLNANPEALEVRAISTGDPTELPIHYPADFEEKFQSGVNEFLRLNFGENPFATATVRGLKRTGPRVWADHLIETLEKKIGAKATQAVHIQKTGTSSFYDHYQLSAPDWVEKLPGWPKGLTINVVKDEVWELGAGAAEKIALKDVMLSYSSEASPWSLPLAPVVADPAHIADGISFSIANSPVFKVKDVRNPSNFRLTAYERDALKKRLEWIQREKKDFDSYASPYVASRTKMKLVSRSSSGELKDSTGLADTRIEDVELVQIDKGSAARAINEESDPWVFHVTNAQGQRVWVRMRLPAFN